VRSPTGATRVDPPTADPRWDAVLAAIRRHGQRREALIEAMHAVQQGFGYLAPESLRFLAESLGLPLARVQGVATFYHHFRLAPPAPHRCVVCLGTVCHLKGARRILGAVERHVAAAATGGSGEAGGAPRDRIAVTEARCIGACSLAPLVVLDGETVGPVSADEVLVRMASWRSGARRDA